MINLEGIKNIIFDFGNVICDIDFNKTVEAFKRLGGEHFSISLEDYIHHPVFGALESGNITNDEFYDQIRQLLGVEVSNEEIRLAWTALIINSDQERITLLQDLGINYRLFLLSNTNDMHIDISFKRIATTFNVDFEQLFEKVYFSHQLKLIKPDDDIYQYVFKDAGIKPEETLFIDDNKQNIATAKRLGMQVYLFNPSKEKLQNIGF